MIQLGSAQRKTCRFWQLAAVLAALALASCTSAPVQQGAAWAEALGKAWNGAVSFVQSELAKLSPSQSAVAAPLVASGVVSVQEVRISVEFAGTIAEMPAQQGATVSQGDVLAVLESRDLQGLVQQAEAAVQSAQADLDLARSGPTDEAVAALRAQVSAKEAGLQGAKEALAGAQAIRDNPQELQRQLAEAQTNADLAEQGIVAAQADLQEGEYERDKMEFGSPQRRMQEHLVAAQAAALDAAKADAKAAQAAVVGLEDMLQDPVSLDAAVSSAQSGVNVATQSLAVAQAQLDALLAGPQPEAVSVAEAALSLTQAQLALAQAQADRLTIVAPVDGIVLDLVASEGESAQPGATLLTLGSLGVVKVTVYVPEGRMGEVSLGQAAGVAVDSFPGRAFAGTVTHIADQAEYTPRNIATKEGRTMTFFAVDISVPNPTLELKSGMPADVAFR